MVTTVDRGRGSNRGSAAQRLLDIHHHRGASGCCALALAFERRRGRIRKSLVESEDVGRFSQHLPANLPTGDVS